MARLVIEVGGSVDDCFGGLAKRERVSSGQLIGWGRLVPPQAVNPTANGDYATTQGALGANRPGADHGRRIKCPIWGKRRSERPVILPVWT